MSASASDDHRSESAADEAARVRFSGIVESDERSVDESDGSRSDYDFALLDRDERKWNAMSRQIWQLSRYTAIFTFFAFIIGLPFGNFLAHWSIYQDLSGWNFFAAYGPDTLIYAIIIPLLVLFIGYAGSKGAEMLGAAQSIAVAAQQMVTPDVTAARNAQTVGAVVQTQMIKLNEGIDGSLTRLASVEAMIRKHVEAIEIAGDAIEQRAVGAVERVAAERSRLMDLTESLNAHADSFAAAIAEKARASIESVNSANELSDRAESDLEERLGYLENAAARALSSFDALATALRDTDETMRSSAESISQSAQSTTDATRQANAAANEAANSAARNAANVAASANRAAAEAKKAADNAIEIAANEAERISQAAIEAAASHGEKMREATSKTLGDVSQTTKKAIETAVSDADRASQAATDVSQAAQRAGEAAAKASSDVVAASERAKQSAEQAVKFSEAESARIDERNQALASARAALEKENARLESLIDEQRKRADRLAEAIASQTERLSRLAEAQLREQEASARLAEAQNEMQRRADAHAAEKKRLASAPAPKAKQGPEATLDLRPAAPARKAERKPAPSNEPPKSSGRLDELAKDIAGRRPRREEKPVIATKKTGSEKASAPARKKKDVSWREILDAAEDAEPLDLGSVSKNAGPANPPDEQNAIRIIAQLQDFTYDLETRLYGDPPPALAERFDRGDRNVFANRILRLNEADVKRRIKTESGRDRDFERSVHQFLNGFERLLEDATTSETADEELEEYLSSPLGRVYLLIGATVGYFA